MDQIKKKFTCYFQNDKKVQVQKNHFLSNKRKISLFWTDFYLVLKRYKRKKYAPYSKQGYPMLGHKWWEIITHKMSILVISVTISVTKLNTKKLW